MPGTGTHGKIQYQTPALDRRGSQIPPDTAFQGHGLPDGSHRLHLPIHFTLVTEPFWLYDLMCLQVFVMAISFFFFATGWIQRYNSVKVLSTLADNGICFSCRLAVNLTSKETYTHRARNSRLTCSHLSC